MGNADLKREVEINGDKYTMCEDVFNEEVARCEECGKYEWKDEFVYVDEFDKYFCRDCYKKFMDRKKIENTLPCSECVHYVGCSEMMYEEYGYGIAPNEVLDLCNCPLPLSEIEFINDETKKKFYEQRERVARSGTISIHFR